MVSLSLVKRFSAVGNVVGACVSSTALVSISADHNTVSSPALSDGETKKLQAPFPMELELQGRTVGMRPVRLVFGIAPEPFPGEIGRVEGVQIVVSLRGPPAGGVGRHRCFLVPQRGAATSPRINRLGRPCGDARRCFGRIAPC